MEILQREIFFSKQGKSSAHAHSILFTGQKKRPKPKSLNLIDPSDPSVFTYLKPSKIQQTPKKVSQPDHTFRSVSRSKRDEAFRNRTDSPAAGLYTPKYSAIDPRVNQGPVFKPHLHKPRIVKLEIPNCLNHDLQCTFPKHNRCKPREALTITEIQTKIKNRKIHEKHEKPQHLNRVNFHLQTPRKPFVNETDPPNEERFAYINTNSFMYSKNHRPQTVSFKKMIARKELIEVQKSAGPYDAKERLVRPRTDMEVLNFKMMGGRKPMVLKERLATPDSPALEVLDRAHSRQSNVRGVVQMPKISSVVPRDDSMYRTTEAYSLNTSKYLKINGLEL